MDVLLSRDKLTPSLRDPADLFQRDAARTIAKINTNPLLGGVQAQRVTFKAGATTRVPHTLGRPPVGFLVTMADSHSTFYLDGDATSTHLPLNASADCVASFWIF